MTQQATTPCLRKEFFGPIKPCAGGEFQLRLVIWEPEQGPIKGSIAYLHPGAFRAGNADGVDGLAPEICARGMRAISIAYRLGGQAEDLRSESRAIMEQLYGAMRGKDFQGLMPRLRDAACFCAIEDAIDLLNLAGAAEEIGPLGPLVLFGDSAGGIASLSIVTTPALKAQLVPDVAAVMSLSGALPFLEAVDPRQGPPVYWLHCAGDRKVSSQSALAMAALAHERAQPTEVHLLRGVAHGWFMFARGLVPFADPKSPFSIFWDYAEARIDEASRQPS